MNLENAYSFGKTVTLTFDDAVDRITQALAEQGFGILTEIDVAAKFKEKLNIDYQPYRILGACNPKLAHKVLGMEPTVGVLLPCNVIVYVDQQGKTNVVAMDPAKAMQMIDNPAVAEVATEVRRLLGVALDKLA